MSCDQALYIKNVPMNAKWEIEDAVCFSSKDVTPAALDGKYFILNSAAGVKFKFWFDVDNLSVEPVVASTAAQSVEITASSTAAQIMDAIKLAVDLATDYTVTITNGYDGRAVYVDTSKVAAPIAGTAGDILGLTRSQIGGSIDLGLLDGDITFDPSIDKIDLTAHQSGGIVVGQLITSVGGAVSLTLKEYNPARYRELYEAIGGKSGATAVTGFGSAMIGKNLLSTGKRLVLHPVYKLAADKTEDYTFWKAVPELGSVTFSGENPNTLPLAFTAFIDNNRDTTVNVWAFGDVSTLP